MSQVHIFVSSALQKCLLGDRGLWIQSQLTLLTLLTLTSSHCAGEWVCRGLRQIQTISRAFRQKHCPGLSSRGCLTSSSRLRVQLGLIVCQMTCQAVRIKGLFPLQSLLPLWYSVYCSVIKCCDLRPRGLLSFSFYSNICFLIFPRTAIVLLQTKCLDLFAVAVGRGGYNDTNNCSKNTHFREK